MKLFQNLTSSFREEDFLGISVHVRIVKVAPIHHSHVYERIKNFAHKFLERTLKVHFYWGLEATYSVVLIDLATELTG